MRLIPAPDEDTAARGHERAAGFPDAGTLAIRTLRSPYRLCPLGAHVDHQLGLTDVEREHVVLDHQLEVVEPELRAGRAVGLPIDQPHRGDVLEVLRGRHIHVWRETDGYSVLIPGDDARIGFALRQIAASEAGCTAHTEHEVEHTAEGHVFSAHGDNAFLFAQFFLALEHRSAP